ncbi:MAG: hypothetical protein V1495_05855 [Pseudomonadota bacterium]
MGRLHLTFDIDWAPDFVLEDLDRLLADVTIPVTVFSTHKSSMIRKLASRTGTEIAILPNLLKLSDEASRLKEVLKLFPGSKGIRVHWLYYHHGLLELFHRSGLEYLSNDLLFLQHSLEPFYDWTGLVRIPIYWSDDVHLIGYERNFDLSVLRLDNPGLKVLVFQPVHIYLNTSSMVDYVKQKALLRDPSLAASLRNPGPGIRTLFLEVLERMKKEDSTTLYNVVRDFKKAGPYAGSYHPMPFPEDP